MAFFRTFSCFLRFLRAFDDLCALFDHLFLDIVIVKRGEFFGGDFGGFGVDKCSNLCIRFLAVSFPGYCVVRLPSNPRRTTVRLRLGVG